MGARALNFGGSHEQIENSGFPTSSSEFRPPPARPPAQARPQVHIVGPRQRHHLKKAVPQWVGPNTFFPTICDFSRLGRISTNLDNQDEFGGRV